MTDRTHPGRIIPACILSACLCALAGPSPAPPEVSMSERLGSSSFVAFLSTARPAEAREFYEKVLGLTFLEEEPRTLVFLGNGNHVRIDKVDQVPPPHGTALGWSVPDIAIAVRRLEQSGVRFERFPGLSFDDQGVCTFPNGDRVAWFKDPDGNVLSITEFSRRP